MITYSDNHYIMANIYVLEKLGKDKITKSGLEKAVKEECKRKGLDFKCSNA